MPPIHVLTHALPPTPLIPNSPFPLIHYPRLLLPLLTSPTFTLATLYDLYLSNGWESQWAARYGPTQASHYHSAAHECMTVISGEGATIRFGVADTATDTSSDSPSEDSKAHTHGSGNDTAHEDGALYIQAELGDVFILPAGVAHKTFDARPAAPFAFYQCKDGEGRVIREEAEARKFFQGVPAGEGFMMMGSYPRGCEWDFKIGGEHRGREGEVWSVRKPRRDPVLGDSEEGLCGLWGGGKGGSKL